MHAAFVWSRYAHAHIEGIDSSAALELDGIVAIYTAEDLSDYWKPGPLLDSPPPIKDIVFNELTQVPLAKDKIRFVGEPVALVLAESRYITDDAIDRVWVDYDPIPVVVDLELALEDGTAFVHEDLGSNVAAHVIQKKGNYDEIRDKADLIFSRRFLYDRGAAAAMENRGVVAEWNSLTQRLTVWATTQAPATIRNGLAGMLGISENQVRVIAPFIGGGFGPKIIMYYQE